jgi:hypothetical protein
MQVLEIAMQWKKGHWVGDKYGSVFQRKGWLLCDNEEYVELRS